MFYQHLSCLSKKPSLLHATKTYDHDGNSDGIIFDKQADGYPSNLSIMGVTPDPPEKSKHKSNNLAVSSKLKTFGMFAQIKM